MTQVITILTAIALVMAVLALVGVGIVIHNIKSDKPIRQDDHDYSDDYTDPAKILGGTCNWDEEQDK
jgi:hypothetical protein